MLQDWRWEFVRWEVGDWGWEVEERWVGGEREYPLSTPSYIIEQFKTCEPENNFKYILFI